MLFGDCDSCKALLEDKGYIVIPPIESRLTTPKELVRYFYNKIKSLYNIAPEDFNWGLENIYARTFILQLPPTSDIKDKVAYTQAERIIDAVFKDIRSIEKYFKVDTLKLFIMHKTSWLIDRAMNVSSEDTSGYTAEDRDSYEAAYESYLSKETFKNDILRKIVR